METLNLESLQALAQVPPEVLHELKLIPVAVLRALREVPPEALLGLRAATAAEPSEIWSGEGCDELRRAFDHVYEVIHHTNYNVVGTIGKFQHADRPLHWINVFMDSGGGGVDRLLDTPPYKAAEALSVLGNEVRLSILRILFDGAKSAAELVTELGRGTTGQAYHHLRELEGINAVEARDGKYHFNGAFTRVYLTALLVAAEAGHTGPYDKPGDQGQA